MKKKPTAAECREGCVYASSVGGLPCCNYLMVERHPRGCPPGKDCTKYEKGKKKKAMVEDYYDFFA